MKTVLSKKALIIIAVIIVLAVPAIVLPFVLSNNPAPQFEEVEVIYISEGVEYYKIVLLKGAKISIAPAIPSREGFVFEGWFLDFDIWAQPFDEQSPITEDITVYASWRGEDDPGTPDSFMVFVNGGLLHNGYPVFAFVEGSNVEITALVPQGQRFLYWRLAGSDTLFYDNPHSFGVHSDMEWTAAFESIAGYYKVTVSGGTLEGGAAEASYEAGTSVSVTAVIPDGKSFFCWQINDEEYYSNPYVFELGAQDVEIVAVFQDEIVESERGLQYAYDETSGGYFIISFVDSGETSLAIPGRYDNGVNGMREVTRINQNVFANTSLNMVILPDTIDTIGNAAFANCSNLDAVYIPSSVQFMGANVFADCPKLTVYSETATALPGWNLNWSGGSAIVRWGCTGTGITNGIRYVKLTNSTAVVLKYLGAVANLVMPNTVTEGVLITEIAPRAFGNNQTLRRVTLSNGITVIGEDAFSGCSKLLSVITKSTNPAVLANSVFPNFGFGLCVYVPGGRVESYKLASGWNYYASTIYSSDIISGSFAVDDGSLLQYLGSAANVVIPENVMRIGALAFLGHYELVTLTISAGVEEIDGLPFGMDFPNFVSVILDPSNTNFIFDGGVLYNYTKSKLIWYPHTASAAVYEAPDTLIEIADYAFIGSQVFSVDLKNVERIGLLAFVGSAKLEEIRFGSATPPVLAMGAFMYAEGSVIKVPQGSAQAYSAVFAGYTIVEE